MNTPNRFRGSNDIRRRIFTAFWPDAATRDALSRHAIQAARHGYGRATREDQLHLTWVYVGMVRDAVLPRLTACVAARLPAACEWRFERIAGFTGKRLAYLAAERPTADVEAAQAALSADLRALGHPIETRAYRPHVTLARHCDPARLADACRALDAPLIWRARELALVESVTTAGGAVYRVCQRWPLAASD